MLLLCLLLAMVVLAHGAAQGGAQAHALAGQDVSLTASTAGIVDHAGPGDHCGTAAQCHLSGGCAMAMPVSGTWDTAGHAGSPIAPALDTLRTDDTPRRPFHPPRFPARA